MTVRELYEWGIRELSEMESPKTDARVILEHLLGIDGGKLSLCYPDHADCLKEEYFRKIAERKAYKPLSYITGKKEFFSRNFHVREGVLVPRPETENLVSEVLERLPKEPVRIADVCSGSGCIGITLSLESGNFVDLYELSPDAIIISQENKESLGADKVTVYSRDILTQSLETEYDVIVSNPPYIPKADMELLMPDVRDYEPQMALTDGGDGLVFYKRLAELSKTHLKEGGILAAEVGINQHRMVAEIFSQVGKVEILSDYFGVERVVLAKKGVF